VKTILCAACEVQLVPSRNGVFVIQHAEFGPSAVWKADELKCPKCAARIVANFSNKPLAEYWQNKQFQAMLKLAKRDPHKLVECYDFEKSASAHAG